VAINSSAVVSSHRIGQADSVLTAMSRNGPLVAYQIEHRIRAEGYEEARQELDRSFLRQELNEMCKQARGETPKDI